MTSRRFAADLHAHQTFVPPLLMASPAPEPEGERAILDAGVELDTNSPASRSRWTSRTLPVVGDVALAELEVGVFETRGQNDLVGSRWGPGVEFGWARAREEKTAPLRPASWRRRRMEGAGDGNGRSSSIENGRPFSSGNADSIVKRPARTTPPPFTTAATGLIP